jgi:hypothetical protein
VIPARSYKYSVRFSVLLSLTSLIPRVLFGNGHPRSISKGLRGILLPLNEEFIYVSPN